MQVFRERVLPCHPYRPGHPGGGVHILPAGASRRVVVYDPLTDEAVLSALLANEEVHHPALLVTRGVLFDLFPDLTWCIGRPWRGQVTFRVQQRYDDRASGIYILNERTQLPWSGRVYHSASGPMWRYSLPGLPDHDPRDVVLLGRMIAAVHGLVTQQGEEAAPRLNNLFRYPPLPYLHAPFSVEPGGNLWVIFGRRTGAIQEVGHVVQS
jgi:hypothetical protein